MQSRRLTKTAWEACYSTEQPSIPESYQMRIVDRVGGGDAYSGALIFALLANMPPQRAVSFAAAASCLKHSIHGDFNHASLQEVEALVQGSSGGRIQR